MVHNFGGGDITTSAFRRYPWWRGKGVMSSIGKVALIAFLAGHVSMCNISGENDTQQKLEQCRAEQK